MCHCSITNQKERLTIFGSITCSKLNRLSFEKVNDKWREKSMRVTFTCLVDETLLYSETLKIYDGLYAKLIWVLYYDIIAKNHKQHKIRNSTSNRRTDNMETSLRKFAQFWDASLRRFALLTATGSPTQHQTVLGRSFDLSATAFSHH